MSLSRQEGVESRAQVERLALDRSMGSLPTLTGEKMDYIVQKQVGCLLLLLVFLRAVGGKVIS